MPLPLQRRETVFRILFLLVFAAAAFAYVAHRQRGIGACDWFGYFELGQLFARGQVSLDTLLPAQHYPALVPLGFLAEGGPALPYYSPGYPLLLAAASFGHAEFFVTPLLGLLSGWLLFLLARDLTDRWTALAATAAWLFFPIVVYASTKVMNDIAATVPLLASYLLYRRKHLPASALLLGFSLCIRPTNALYCLAFALPLLRDRQVVRFVLWMLPTAGAYALYNQLLYGAPWKTGYNNLAADLTTVAFGGHLTFFLVETVKHLGPLALCAGFVRQVRPRSELVFYVLWFAAYLLFFSFWRSGGTYWPVAGEARPDSTWWWMRFLLPAYPPLFLLTALGLHRIREYLAEPLRSAAVRQTGQAALVALVLCTPLYQIRLGAKHRDLWLHEAGLEYVRTVRAVEAIAPPGSCIGSVEFAGSFRVYSDRVPFVSTSDNAPALVTELFRRGRPVYLVVEPWNSGNPVVQLLLARHRGEPIREIPVWGAIAVTVYRLAPAAAP